MSGIEIAGIVLAALPLAVSGLQHYADGVGTFRRMVRRRRRFERLRADLELERVIFTNTLETLLTDSLDARTCGVLLTQLGGSYWYDPEVDHRLREGLQRSYDVFFKAVYRMNETRRELVEALQLDADGKGPFAVDRRSVKRYLKQVGYMLDMERYDEQLRDISRCNDRLERLAVQSIALSQQPKQSARVFAQYRDLRSHATSVFESVCAGLSRSCGEQHRVNLSMETLATTSDDRKVRLAESVVFKVVFEHCALGAKAVSCAWEFAETDIRICQSLPVLISEAQSLQQTMQTGTSRSNKSRQDRTPLREITDICSGLASLGGSSQGACLGYMSDVQNNFRLALFWPTRRIISSAPLTAIPLSDILGSPDRPWISDLDRRYLALSLACGMLTLSGTAWLSGSQWGKRDITVFRQPAGVLLSRPFVTQQLHELSTTSQGHFESCNLIRDEATFALGILLIELCLGSTLDDLRAPHELDKDGVLYELSDYLTAARLVNEVYKIAGGHWGDVVRRCVHCEFDQRNVGLENADFRQAVYEKVVAVLEKDVHDAQSW